MIDLHTHILPELDDGSRSLEDSLEMAALAVESGDHYLVATPHANQMGRFENFLDRPLISDFQYFQKKLQEAQIPLHVLLGMEIYASEDMGEKIRNGHLIGLNNTRYYLVEWDFDEDPDQILHYLHIIQREGGTPLIAHPERYFCVQDYPQLVYDWTREGCLAQINKGSIFGRFGRRVQETADVLLENGLVTCVATDAHSPQHRTTYLKDGKDYLEEQYGPTEAWKLLHTNPMNILLNKPVRTRGRRPEEHHYYYY